MSSSVQLLSCVQLFVTPYTAAHQPSWSITNSWSLLKPMSFESVMPSNHLILCCPLLLLPLIFPSIGVFSNKSVPHIMWPEYWSFSFSISPSNEYSDWFPLGLTNFISFQSKGLSRVFFSTTAQRHQFFGAQLSHPYMTLLSVSQFVVQSCPTLFNPMDCSKPGFPVHHQLLKLAQTHVSWISDPPVGPSYNDFEFGHVPCDLFWPMRH